MESSGILGRRCATVLASTFLVAGLSGCIVVQPSSQPTADNAPPGSPAAGAGNETVTQTPSSTATGNTSPQSTEALNEWADVVEQTRSGVALVDTTQCTTVGNGTGFLIGEDLVVTAAHVVDGSTQIHLTIGEQLVPALVLGSNETADIALLKTSRPVEGHQFEFAKVDPRIGTRIAAMGYPLALEIEQTLRASKGFKFTEGSISGLNQDVLADGILTTGAMQTDAAINAGNSGGPLIDSDGSVVGMAFAGHREAEGTAYGVPSQRVQEAVDQWRAASSVQPLASCDAGEAPDRFILTPVIDSQHDQALYVAQSFVSHGSAINTGNYEEAFKYFTGPMQARVQGAENWSRGLNSSYWAHVNVYDIEGSGDSLEANVELWTIQDPVDAPEGTEQWCSAWDNKYQMRWSGVAWTIDSVSANQKPAACDAQMLVNQLGEQQTGYILDMAYRDYSGFDG